MLEKLVIINAPHPAIFRELLMNDAEQQLVSDINIDRAQSGLPGLVINPALSRIARGAPISVCPGESVHGRSQDMIERGYFSHQIPSCGQYVWPALQAAGVCHLFSGVSLPSFV